MCMVTVKEDGSFVQICNCKYGSEHCNKEMLQQLIVGQQLINSRIDELHEKVNTKISRSELMATATFIVILIGGIIQYSM